MLREEGEAAAEAMGHLEWEITRHRPEWVTTPRPRRPEWEIIHHLLPAAVGMTDLEAADRVVADRAAGIALRLLRLLRQAIIMAALPRVRAAIIPTPTGRRLHQAAILRTAHAPS